MFRLLSPAELREWQIWWYTEREKKARDPHEKAFVQNELKNLKKLNNCNMRG